MFIGIHHRHHPTVRWGNGLSNKTVSLRIKRLDPGLEITGRSFDHSPYNVDPIVRIESHKTEKIKKAKQ